MLHSLIEHLLREDSEMESKEAWFEERTNNHISLVQKAAQKIADKYPDEFGNLPEEAKDHDASKLVEPERTPYVEITWRHKLEKEKNEYDPINNKGYQKPGNLSKKEENEATERHIFTNKHHPEYWSVEGEEYRKNLKDE